MILMSLWKEVSILQLVAEQKVREIQSVRETQHKEGSLLLRWMGVAHMEGPESGTQATTSKKKGTSDLQLPGAEIAHNLHELESDSSPEAPIRSQPGQHLHFDLVRS